MKRLKGIVEEKKKQKMKENINVQIVINAIYQGQH